MFHPVPAEAPSVTYGWSGPYVTEFQVTAYSNPHENFAAYMLIVKSIERILSPVAAGLLLQMILTPCKLLPKSVANVVGILKQRNENNNYIYQFKLH